MVAQREWPSSESSWKPVLDCSPCSPILQFWLFSSRDLKHLDVEICPETLVLLCDDIFITGFCGRIINNKALLTVMQNLQYCVKKQAVKSSQLLYPFAYCRSTSGYAHTSDHSNNGKHLAESRPWSKASIHKWCQLLKVSFQCVFWPVLPEEHF